MIFNEEELFKDPDWFSVAVKNINNFTVEHMPNQNNLIYRQDSTVKTYHGFRSIHFTSNHGFFLNKAQYKIRGFCDHDNFGIVGMAVPERINLFRVSYCSSYNTSLEGGGVDEIHSNCKSAYYIFGRF